MHPLSSMNDLELMGQGLQAMSSMNEVEILGANVASLLESLGAEGAAHATRVREAVTKMRTARAIDPHAVGVIQQAYNSMAWLPTGIPATLFTALTATQNIVVSTSRPTKPREVEIPSFLSPFFVINNATIRGVEQLNAPGVPTETYSTAALRSKVQWVTINTSTPLTLNVTMIDLTVDRTFRGCLQGPTLLG